MGRRDKEQKRFPIGGFPPLFLVAELDQRWYFSTPVMGAAAEKHAGSILSFSNLSGRVPRLLYPIPEVPQSPSIVGVGATAHTVPTEQMKNAASAFGVCIFKTKEQTLL